MLKKPEDNATHEEPTDAWSQDGNLLGCHQLERRWLLWHSFMTDHARLDAWLRLAEQAVSSHNWTQVTCAAAKNDVRRFENLRCEAGSNLVHLDALTQRNRTLTVLFNGAMRARLLAAAQDCGHRWDRLSVKLESISRRLKGLVSEWEEFEEETEDLAVWLSEMEVRLMGVQQMTGNTCDKLRQLQSFQQSVSVNCSRVNGVLERGEALIQRSTACDARRVECRLLELLRQCSHVYSNIARTHTRLLSMRLVFEDDFLLTLPPDSGCPSETLFEEEGALDKVHQDLPASRKSEDLHHHHPHRPPSPSSPSHEHLGLEWDPSVDVGRSCSDFSYYSASTGGPRETPNRWSYISSLSSDVISSDIIKQEDALHLKSTSTLPDVFSPEADIKSCGGDHWVTSTPEHDCDGRVRAWLGVHSADRPSCCKAVQTDNQRVTVSEWDPAELATHIPSCHGNDSDDLSLTWASLSSYDPNSSSDWTPVQHQTQEEEEEESCCAEAEQRGFGFYPAAKCLLLAVAAVSLLACHFWCLLEPSCRRRSIVGASSGGLHLSYVNGPPPT
ncbi:nesprin-2 [Festucalex cinctus]